MNEKAFQKYLATGVYVPAEDGAPVSLSAHDKRFHPNGFDPKKDRCEFREKQKNGDEADAIRQPPKPPSKTSGVSDEEDAAYLDAVKRGDMKTARRMVLSAAAKAMPNTKIKGENGEPKVVFHGSPYMFTVFGEEDKSNSAYHGFISGLFFFTDSERAAKGWTHGVEQLHLGGGDFSGMENLVSDKKRFLDFIDIYKKTNGNIPADLEYVAFQTNRIFNGVEEAEEETRELAQKGVVDYKDNPVLNLRTKIENAIDQYLNGNRSEKKITGKVYRVFLNVTNPNVVNGDQVTPTSKWQDDFDGMDGMIIHNSDIGNAIADEYIVDNPRQIKSADPVTYDDDGHVIPLSKRFDFTNPDIRY